MTDIEMMRAAIEESRQSIDEDGRNHPRVGAIIAKEGVILSSAHRGEIKGSHAEYIALRKFNDANINGAIVYTTLEPCTSRNHPKVSCAERLIHAKVGHVVVGMLDPNPEISGKGVRLLRRSGIKVTFFPDDLMKEVEEINKEFDSQFDLVSLASQKQTVESFQTFLNIMYANTNSRLVPEYLYGHLHKSADLLITCVSKAYMEADGYSSVEPIIFIRTVSWLFSLATKLGCDLQSSFFKKFPGACPYCLEQVCDCEKLGKTPKPFRDPATGRVLRLSPIGIEDSLLEKYDDIRQRNTLTLDFAMENIRKIYPFNNRLWRKCGPYMHCFKILEELAEVHEAVAKFIKDDAKDGKKLIGEELADVLAWVLSMWDYTYKGRSMDLELFNYYFKGCPVCFKTPCECQAYTGRNVRIIGKETLISIKTLLTQLHELTDNEIIRMLIKNIDEAMKLDSDSRTRIAITEMSYQITILEKGIKITDAHSKEIFSVTSKLLSVITPIVKRHKEQTFQVLVD